MKKYLELPATERSCFFCDGFNFSIQSRIFKAHVPLTCTLCFENTSFHNENLKPLTTNTSFQTLKSNGNDQARI